MTGYKQVSPGFRKGPRFRNSLLSRFVLIVVIAMVLLPIVLPLTFVASLAISSLLFHSTPKESAETKLPNYGSGIKIERMWHEEALALHGKSSSDKDQVLQRVHDKYPEATLFWVDSDGKTQLKLPETSEVPDYWSTEKVVAYMKQAYDSDPFTTVAIIGGGEQPTDEGFMVLELPRKYMNHTPSSNNNDGQFYGMYFFMVIFALFLLLAYWFFRDIQKRLRWLEFGMTVTGKDGLPTRIIEGRPDEIGRLEQAFNHMVDVLHDSRRKEREEETLRKNLISNLSHDLRTPLTVLGGQLYSFRKEPLSPAGKEMLELMEGKINDLSGLIDHLLSYNLLTSGRYSMKPEELDVLRIVRLSAAAWYPLWEKAGMEIHIELPEEPLIWRIDEQGFRRVLDNLFQNTIRHARSGGYIGISVLHSEEGKAALAITDHGPGMSAESPAKGAGLGLQVVDLLLREMGLVREAVSANGTRVIISQK
ncbi:HAMP domain-containing histidine kinase [Paenibacillus sp. MSJ-6]|uniref:histidine kinase n=2 Tax=Paenibacillus brevis TaxID=2841508 RepID=A0ABS6FKB2_9BACL|nr:HAMP domain-containing histidine kinase [Paenibacillus brevis]